MHWCIKQALYSMYTFASLSIQCRFTSWLFIFCKTWGFGDPTRDKIRVSWSISSQIKDLFCPWNVLKMNVTQKDKNDINELSVSRNIATQVMCVCVCIFGFNVAFNNFSVISRWCLVVTGSSLLTFIELPHWSIMSQTLDMIPHPVTLSWHWVNHS